VSLYDNLITNGDFEQGNVGFTSGLTYKSGTGNILVPTSSYAIATDPKLVHSAFTSMVDHTTGKGKMMVINGSIAANVVVWSQKVTGIKPNTKYLFSAYLASCTPSAPAILSFTINDQKQGNNISPNGLTSWTQFYAEWNSGSTTGDATITITNLQAGDNGNDFALDDISLTEAPKPCAGTLSIIEKDDMGTGSSNFGDPLDVKATNYTYTTLTIGPGKYSRIKNPRLAGVAGWADDTDHTGNGGYMLIFDASNEPGIYYEKEYTNLCSGIECNFSIQAANLATNSTWVKPKVKIELINPTTKAVLQSFSSSELAASAEKKLLWNELSMSFTVPAGVSSVIMRVSNIQTLIGGNDIGFDDVVFSICVPDLKIDTGQNPKKICKSTSTTLTIADLPDYHFQWQSYNGTDWKDIPNETNKKYVTPILTTDTKYRVRYAATGIDIANNNGFKCSGNTEVLVEVNPPPTVKVTFDQNSICSGAAMATVNFEGPSFAKVTYSVNGTKETIDLDPDGLYSTSFPITNNAKFFIEGIKDIYNASCPNFTERREIIIPSKPTIKVTTSPASICSGSGATIYFEGPPRAKVTYSIDNSIESIELDEDGIGDISVVVTTYTKLIIKSIKDIYNTSCPNTTLNQDVPLNVTAASKAFTASAEPVVCAGMPIQNITHTTAGATGINITGAIKLPTGVTASWNSNTITISGTPTSAGVYNYSIPLTGGCGSAAATGKITVTSQSDTRTTTNATICMGETALLSAVTGSGIIPAPVTVFADRWNTATDPKSLMPTPIENNVATCKFYPNTYGSYKTITFSVNVTGTYSLQMTGANMYFRAGYLYKGNYVLGTCPGDGTWITGDDDFGFIGTKNPTLTAHLEVGTLYTLVSIINAYNDPNYSTGYTWTLTPPEGGGFYLTPLNLWYTSATGGDPIGWGPYLNPVETPNSGIVNQPGATTFYAGDATGCTTRVPAIFTILENNTAGAASSAPSVYVNTVLPAITHTTTKATGIDIGAATGLPAGITASWAANTITIHGTPTIAGDYDYSIPLTGGCGNIAATGKITVKPANTITLTSANATQNIFIKNAITNIVYTTNASGVTVTGLPPGVTGVFNAGIFTISGTPTTEGVFDFSVTTTGSTTVSLTGTITVSSIPLSAWIMMEDDNRNGLIEPGEKLKFKLYVANIDPNHAPLLNVSGSIDLPVHTTIVGNSATETPNSMSFFDSSYTQIPYYWDMVTMKGGPYVGIVVNADCNLTDVSKIDVIGRVYINGVQVKMSVPVLSSNPTAEWIALNGDATKSYCIPPDLENCASPTGCPSSFPVNINPKLTITKPAAVCSGSTLNLTTPEITIGTPLKTKNWYLDGTIFTPTTVVTTADNGKTLQYKASNNCSDESSNSVTITVNANPDVPVIVSTASTCSKAGTSTISNYISGNTYTFSPTGPGVDAQGLISSMTVGTLYDVTSKDANCTSLASAQFKNGPQLAAPEAPTCTKADPITCAILTGSITVTAPIGTNYQYAIDGGTYQSSPVFSIVSKGGHSVTVKEISTGCISAGQNVTINAAPSAPTAAISYPASSYTNIGTAEITRTGQTGGTYSATPAGLSINATTGIINLSESLLNTYTVTYAFSNASSCTNTATTAVTVTGPQITAWLSVVDANKNGIVESGETLTFMLEMANIDPNHVTLKNVTGSVKLPAHTTLISSDIYVYPNTFTFSSLGNLDFPYIWNLGWMRQPAIVVRVRADCDLTGVDKIETIGMVYVDGVEVKVSSAPVKVSDVGTYKIINSDDDSYLQPPALANCPEGCPTGLSVSTIKKQELQVNNPAAVCAPATVDITTAAITSGSTGIGTLTYFTDALGTITLTNPKAVPTSGTYYIKSNITPDCFVIKPVAVIVNPNPAITFTKTDPTTCALTTGNITVTAPIGANYVYALDNGAYQSEVLFEGVTSGNHTITAKETVSGCIPIPANVAINAAPSAPQKPTFTKTDPTTCAVVTGSITVTAPIGAGYQYAIDGGTYQLSPLFSGVSTGSHSVTVKEILTGCVSAEQNVTINAAPSAPTAAISYLASSYTNVGTAEITQTGQTDGTYSATPAGLSINATTGIINLSESLLNTYTVTYAFSNASSCTNTATTEVTVTGPQITAWLSVVDENGNGIVEPGEKLSFIFEIANIDPNHVTLENVKGSVKLPNNTTAISTTDIFLYPNTHSFTKPDYLSFPYIWDFSYQRRPKFKIDFIADCDLTGVDRIETVGMVFINGEEVKVSVPPTTISDIGTYVNAGGEDLNYIQPPALANCPGGCPTGLPVSAIKKQELEINNPAPICAPATVDITAAVITSGSIGIGALTYFTDEAATQNLATPTAVTTSGTYYIKSTIAPNCFVIEPVAVTVSPKPEEVVTIENICFGEKYTWAANGIEYSESASITLEKDGCTPDQVLKLTVGTKPEEVVTIENICFGEKYTWAANGIEYSESASITLEKDGCTPDQVLKLTVGTKPEEVVTIENICFGEKYTWAANGIEYSESASITLEKDGCTPDQLFKLTVGTKPEEVVTIENICFGEKYTWAVNGIEYTASETVTVEKDGCTADQTLILTVGTKPETIVTTENICFGEKYTWAINNIEYTASETVTVEKDGCTADQTLILTVGTKPETIVTTENICSGEKYVWAINNIEYTASETITVEKDGCTADQALILTVGTKPETIVTTENICFGEKYTWAINSIEYTASETVTVEKDGCTADQTLILTLGTKPETIVTTENICFGEKYTWAINNIEYTASETVTVEKDGCTADQTLILTVGTKPETIVTTENICSGEKYTWAINGIEYDQSTSVTKENNGCTADQILILTVGTKPETIVTTENICSGEKYTWAINGIEYDQSTSVTKENNGCTADQTLILTVGTKPETVVTTENICSGEKYTWAINNIEYTASETVTVEKDGCTADQTLILTVGTKPETVVTTENICFGEKYTWTVNNTVYNTAGTYLLTNDGCTADQELILNITTKPTRASTSQTICSGETYTWAVNNTVYNTAGTYLMTNDGCTADQELILNITAKPTKTSTSKTICSAETYTWAVNNIIYNTAGTYLMTNDGCTADQELVLNITAKPTKVSTSQTICSGETYIWAVNNTVYNTAGTYLLTNDGCTADQELILTVTVKPADIVTTESICSGATYTWAANGTAYTAEQNGIRISKNGCTADQVLNLKVYPIPQPVLQDGVICVNLKTGAVNKSYILDSKLNKTEYDFAWYYNSSKIDEAMSETYEASKAGEYEVIAINKNTGCVSYSVMANVTVTNPGLELQIDQSAAFGNEDAAVTINVTGGNANYEYQLDNDGFGTPNVILDVKPGSHIITVRDTSGCTYLSKEIYTVGYPKFFTPNGDGYNDTWNIMGIGDQPNAKIYIYDRYGKLLKQILPTGSGWDGTYNGAPLPASDYWFTLEYTEKGASKIFKSHFTLKR
jgi:gliding motility-associated-like protein